MRHQARHDARHDAKHIVTRPLPPAEGIRYFVKLRPHLIVPAEAPDPIAERHVHRLEPERVRHILHEHAHRPIPQFRQLPVQDGTRLPSEAAFKAMHGYAMGVGRKVTTASRLRRAQT